MKEKKKKKLVFKFKVVCKMVGDMASWDAEWDASEKAPFHEYLGVLEMLKRLMWAYQEKESEEEKKDEKN